MRIRIAVVTAVFASIASAQGRGRGAPINLPDGQAKPLVEATCARCHSLALITNTGYTKDEWSKTISTMVTLTRSENDLIVDYLAQHFPDVPKPRPVIVNGDQTVNFREWALPTKGSRPHDPLATSDGMLWYTGMFSNKMGRVDPKTGTIKEYALPIEGSGPHGLTVDKSGNIWFTANQKGYIGKLDPKSGTVTDYKLPDGTRDPHTPIFDHDGILWFTAQGANRVGRLDPATGDVKVVDSPTQRSNPYGMVITSKNVPVFCEFGSNKIASIDPKTMAITEYPLPNAESRPRRIAIDPEDNIWYADYSRGFLGRIDLKTGATTEWASPSGAKSQPYGITYTKGAIWYFETAVKPNALVRFDPKTLRFQSWPVPGGGGVVRNIMPDRNGNIVIAESGVNMVGVVEIGRQ